MVKTILYVVDAEKYFERVTGIFKDELSNVNVIYVTTNKPYQNIVKMFGDGGIDTSKIFFIDCISMQVLPRIASETKNCFFVKSPDSITSIGIAVARAIEHIKGEKVLFFDSLSTLLLYTDENTVGRFSNFLINKMLVNDVSSIMMVLSSDIENNTIKKIISFVDEVRRDVNGS